MNLTVLGQRVFIRPDSLPETTADGSLHLVYDRQWETMRGTVIAIGKGPEFVKRAVDSVLTSLADVFDRAGSERAATRVREEADAFVSEHLVSVGDRVLFSPDKGEELTFEREILVSMREDDLLAVVEAP